MAGSQKVSSAALLPSFFSFLSTSGPSKTSLAVLWRDSGGEMMLFLKKKLLIDARWWNYVNEEGSSVWVFEKGGDEVDMRLSKAEVQIFWTGLVVSPVIWVSLVQLADPVPTCVETSESESAFEFQAFLFFTALFQLELRWVVLVIIGWNSLSSIYNTDQFRSNSDWF